MNRNLARGRVETDLCIHMSSRRYSRARGHRPHRCHHSAYFRRLGVLHGLAGKLIQKVIPPVEIAQIDKPKEVDKPPPPPPKLEEIKPFVPPPEFVDIQAPQQQTNAISQTTQVQHVAAPTAPPPVQHTRTPIGQDPKHPLHIGEDYYPDASKRAGEEGRCVVTMTVAADGRITDDHSAEQRLSAPR